MFITIEIPAEDQCHLPWVKPTACRNKPSRPRRGGAYFDVHVGDPINHGTVARNLADPGGVQLNQCESIFNPFGAGESMWRIVSVGFTHG